MREIGGGRPKGVLNPSTIEKIKTQEAVQKIILQKAGLITEGLLQNLINHHDTSAGKELFDRAFGKAHQSIDIRSASFSLKELADYRKKLNESSNETEKKT